MEPIKAPMKFGESGTLVANLQEALQLLIERKLIRSFAPPNSPTEAELAKLKQSLADERAQYGSATQRLVQIVQLQEGLGDNLGGDVENKTADALNRLLNLDGTVEGEFTVRGVVSLADGEPAEGIIVRAFDRDLRNSEPLGNKEVKVTDASGRYEIRYSQEQFGRSEKGNADLVVRAFRQDSDSEPLAESPTLFNAPVDAEINLSLTESSPRLSEFERYVDAIKPLLAGQGSKGSDLPFEELNEEDMEFVAGDTGIDWTCPLG